MLITVDCESRETFAAVEEERTSSFPKVKAWFGTSLLLFIVVLAIHGPYTATVCAKFRSLSHCSQSLSSRRKIDRETVVLRFFLLLVSERVKITS